MNTLRVDIKPDFNLRHNPYSVAINTITIEPEHFGICFENRRHEREVPLEVLKDRASVELAKELLNKLKYSTEENKRHNSVIHKFSIYDYTTTERKQQQQILQSKERYIDALETRMQRLLNELMYLKRPIMQKIKEWLLYDKGFGYDSNF